MESVNHNLLHSGTDRRSYYGDLFVALIPAVITGVWLFGLRSAAVLVVCVGAALAAETLYAVLRHRQTTATDLTGIFAALLLGLSLPATLPLWEAAIGGAVGAVAARWLADSVGRRLLYPAVFGHLLLSVAFFGDMTAGAEPIAFAGLGTVGELSPLQLILGLYGGGIGATCLPAMLLGGVYLWLRKTASPWPTVVVATTAAVTVGLSQKSLLPLLESNFFLFAFFLLADPAVRARNRVGVIATAAAVGVVGGLLSMVLPTVGWDCAWLLMGVSLPIVDRYCHVSPFGNLPKQRKVKKSGKIEN